LDTLTLAPAARPTLPVTGTGLADVLTTWTAAAAAAAAVLVPMGDKAIAIIDVPSTSPAA
jgi:hypothetical protein